MTCKRNGIIKIIDSYLLECESKYKELYIKNYINNNFTITSIENSAIPVNQLVNLIIEDSNGFITEAIIIKTIEDINYITKKNIDGIYYYYGLLYKYSHGEREREDKLQIEKRIQKKKNGLRKYKKILFYELLINRLEKSLICNSL